MSIEDDAIALDKALEGLASSLGTCTSRKEAP